MSIVECRGLSKSYSKTPALEDVNLKLEAGRITGILGPNGSGKTTLIKLATGLLQPTEGEILIDGLRPGSLTKSMVAYLPDRDFLPDYMTVEQLMKYYSDFFDDFNEAKAMKMLDSLNIDCGDRLKKLSKGNREKVQLILTMSRDARVYFLDEPIAGVDPAARDYIIKTIITNYNPEALVVICTHLIADVEAVLDDVVFIKEGKVVMQESADAIRDEKGMSIDGLFREVFKC
ncbi:MAG: ABC transporter ATP-binding protein [Firmicutes bacterium]|nr:ABC transporter ATP-binding protein [Bacillota bacterium]MDY2920022.1 ABC transporter ATP-binding protein [Lentihominibacter sp.]